LLRHSNSEVCVLSSHTLLQRSLSSVLQVFPRVFLFLFITSYSTPLLLCHTLRLCQILLRLILNCSRYRCHAQCQHERLVHYTVIIGRCVLLPLYTSPPSSVVPSWFRRSSASLGSRRRRRYVRYSLMYCITHNIVAFLKSLFLFLKHQGK
jgi:hypothetical protein